MASPVIKIKRSAVQNNAPTAAQLELGELALNTYDGKLFTEINDGTTSIVEIGGHLKHLAATGISTFGSDKVVVGAAQTQFLVRGNARVVGVMTVGSGSVTLNDDSVNVGAGTTIVATGFQVGGNGVFVHSTGYNVGNTFVHNAGITGAGANLSGIVTSVGLDINGNISVSGTVDGRDIATDGSKLDGIESGATADQSNAEIRAAVEAASDSNVFTDADHSKLNAIEASATADQTAAEIRTLVESASDSNVFTDADHSKLNAIEASATADQTAAEIKTLLNSNGLVNAQIDASAAIDGTKISPDFGSQEITTTGDITGAGANLSDKLLIGTTTEGLGTYAETLTLAGSTHCGMTIRSATNGVGSIYFSDATSGSGEYVGAIDYTHSDDTMKLYAGVSERLRINSGGIQVTGNITVSGTVDGRDVATDGTKLDGIEASATADQTAAEIKTLLNSDGIVNAQVDASAAIEGTKISPDFGSQNIVTTGNINASQHISTPATGSTFGRLTISNANPILYLTDTNNDSDYSVRGASGNLTFRDETNGATRLQINSSGTVDISGNLDVGAGIDVTGNITVSGTVDGRDVATDGTKLDGIEASADVTDATNVNAAGAVMNSDSTTASMSFVVDEDNMSSDSSTKVPTQQSVKAYVDSEVSGLVDSAPGALNTLNELAAALGDDANFSTTVTNSIATKLPLGGGTMTGNIVMSGSQTVDGRDLSVDGAKLDAIESSATADQTAAEIRTLVESASDSNVFTDADHSKLNAIEASATADQTAAEIRTLVESASDSNVFTDADHSKLNAIEASATADQTASEILTLIKTVDGAGSGLDADTLDGVSSGSFVRSDATDTVSGALTFTNDTTFTGGIDVDGHTEVDNLKSVGIATFSNNAIHANIYSTGISTISGFRFPTSDGDEDQALVTDGSGSLSFKTLSGGGGGATGAATTISAGITTATQGQTAFSTPHPHNDGTSTYSCQVFVNGIKQRPQGASSTKDYTTSSNSTITFVEGLSVGAEVVSVVYFGHTIDEEYFTATQGQVLFPLSGSLSAQKNFRVYVNGVKQRVGSDFGVAAPVTLVQACAEGAHVEIVCDNAEDAFVATDQQTNFTPTSTDISEDNMQVYVNGVQLFKGLDYTIGSPSVTFTDASGLTVGDEVDVCIRRTA